MALTPGKARKILEDGTVHGRGLTDKQKKYFGAIAGGATPVKAINGGWLDKFAMGGSLPGASGMMYARTSGTSPEEPKKAQDGTVMYGTPEYKKAYEEGTFADVPNQLDEVVMYSGVDYEKYPYYNDLSAEQRKYFNDDGPIGRGVRRAAYTKRGLAEDTRDMVTGMLVQQPLSALQVPQSLMVEGIQALRGRDANFLNALTFDTQRTPSQVLNIENPVGAIALDIATDPTTYIGAGLFKKPLMAPFTNALKSKPNMYYRGLGQSGLVDASVDAAAPSLRQSLKRGVDNLTNPLSDTRVGLTELMGLLKGGPFKSKFRGFNESGVKAAADFNKTWQKAPGFQTRFDDFTYQFNDPGLTRQVRNNQNLYKRGLEQLKAKQPELFTPSGELSVPLSAIHKMFPRLADDAMLLRRLNDQVVEGANKINYANNARMNVDQIGATGRFTKVMAPTSADDISYFAKNPNTLGFFRASENRSLISLPRFESRFPNLSQRNWKLSRTIAHENKHAMDIGARATKPEYARTIQSAVPQVTDDYTKVLTGAHKKDIQKVYGNIKNLGDDTTESIEYLSRPQEVAGRIDELRMEYIPKKFWGTDKQYEVSDDLINKIISEGKAGKTSVDVRFFKMIKDKKAFKNLFKVLPAVAAPVAIGSIPQQRDGGRCWPGYKTVAGKTPFSKGSCQKAQDGGWLDKFQEGGVIEDNRGQLAHPGKITKINSNNITMKGVNYPVLGISDTGDTKMMQPGVENYTYDGSSVTEYPMAQDGLKLKTATSSFPYINRVPDTSPQVDFLKDWTNSKRGQELLSNSFDGDEKDIERLTYKRINNLDNVDFSIDDHADDFLGRYNRSRHDIKLNSSLLDTSEPKLIGNQDKDVVLHELSHAQDFSPGAEFNRLTIPSSDQKLINKYRKRTLKDTKKLDASRKVRGDIKDRVNYIGDPTETRARLNSIRYFYETSPIGKEEGMPSIFDSEVTSDMMEVMKDNEQFRELQEVYNDEEILELLNTVSDNTKLSKSSNMGYAKQGESLVSLDQLTNFTNYNTPQPGGWLDKY